MCNIKFNKIQFIHNKKENIKRNTKLTYIQNTKQKYKFNERPKYKFFKLYNII